MSNEHIKYATDQIVVPPDYGTARCICGGELDKQFLCTECHMQFDGAEAFFWKEGMRI